MGEVNPALQLQLDSRVRGNDPCEIGPGGIVKDVSHGVNTSHGVKAFLAWATPGGALRLCSGLARGLYTNARSPRQQHSRAFGRSRENYAAVPAAAKHFKNTPRQAWGLNVYTFASLANLVIKVLVWPELKATVTTEFSPISAKSFTVPRPNFL